MKTTSLLARAAAATATLTVGLAGMMVVAPPAQAALVETDYGFFTFGFGTTAKAEQVGLSSGKTAFSIIGCTRLAGKKKTAFIGAANAPANTPSLSVGAVSSNSETFKENGNVGSRSSNRVAKVVLGDANGVHIAINGLETKAQAWADKNGQLRTAKSFRLADITANTGTPLDQLNPVTKNVFGELTKVLKGFGPQGLVIPGLGRISLGREISTIRPGFAIANAIALEVLLFGPNAVPKGGDDIRVVIGRSHARIYKNMQAGIMRGAGYAAEADVLHGVVRVDKIARQPLPCNGTGGVVKENHTVGLNLGNAGVLDLGVASGRAYGEKHTNGSALAWTEGRVAQLALGQGETRLVIKGVVGHAQIKKGVRGKLFRTVQGTKVASITFGGQERDIDLGDEIELPGLGILKFGVVDRSNPRAISVIAVQLLLLPEKAETTGLVKVNLGVARVRLNRV